MNSAATAALSATTSVPLRKADPAGALVQPGGVVGNRAHFGLAHAGGDRLHHAAVRVLARLVHAALRALERLQLREGIVGVLSRDPRVADRDAGAGRAVA